MAHISHMPGKFIHLVVVSEDSAHWRHRLHNWKIGWCDTHPHYIGFLGVSILWLRQVQTLGRQHSQINENTTKWWMSNHSASYKLTQSYKKQSLFRDALYMQVLQIAISDRWLWHEWKVNFISTKVIFDLWKSVDRLKTHHSHCTKQPSGCVMESQSAFKNDKPFLLLLQETSMTYMYVRSLNNLPVIVQAVIYLCGH